jgi:hypothetical protein
MNNYWKLTLIVLLIGGFLASNAFGYVGYDRAGFWMGLWQGIISPITITLHVFSDGIKFYESNNNGFWYNIGYFIPAICLLELTVPLFIIAWIFKIIFWVIAFLIALVYSAVRAL